MIGHAIAHHTLLDRSGSPGRGLVHLAEDTGVGDGVTLRFLSLRHSSEPELAAALVQEAQVTAAANRPTISAVHESDDLKRECSICAGQVEGETTRCLLFVTRMSRTDPPIPVMLECAKATVQEYVVHNRRTGNGFYR